jgi:hypothetical protein
MMRALEFDLDKIKARAFDRAEWAEPVLRRYHAAIKAHGGAAVGQLGALYEWMFVPPSLWPFNIQDVLSDCLAALQTGKRLNSRHRLLIEFLPPAPDESVCSVVADHELRVHKGIYENLVRTQAKYAQNELTLKTNPEFHRQWKRLKTAFNLQLYRDYKGVLRRTMMTERNLRPCFSVNLCRRAEVFQAVFDAFCLRWNLYGMQNDEPLLLKLAVSISPYGTMIHIPAYWSFDPKRDIRWDAIAKLHRTRVPGRQGSALAEGLAEGLKAADKLRFLDLEVSRRGLKGEKRHEFLCAGLGWVPGTSPKRIARLRAEFKERCPPASLSGG